MTIHFVRPDGSYVGGYDDGATPSHEEAFPAKISKLICIDEQCPEYADQRWLFPGWSSSRWKIEAIENGWRESELIVIANQLMALEETEAGSDDASPLAGSRSQWLIYRTAIRSWNANNKGFLNMDKRPQRPGTAYL